VLSSRLPVPLLIGVRLAARRPRRLILNALSVAVTVGGIVAVQSAHTRLAVASRPAAGFSSVADPRTTELDQLMFVVTVMMVVLAIVNAVFISWATVIDSRRASAVVRSLGATPQQMATGVCAAQLLPAVPGVIIGIPAGSWLYAGLRSGAGGGAITYPPAWWLLVTLVGAVLVLTLLTLMPALLGARRPIVEVLRSERA
jgi:putative ABC transport system permease protein